MKNIAISILILFLFSCTGIKRINQEHDFDSFYINKIASKNDWYFVYANRHDSTFVIVSKKADVVNPVWEKLKIGNYYNFRLSSIIPVINGVKMIPINYLDFTGIRLDERTSVNINPEKGIYDIYSSENFIGIYLVK